MLCCFAGYLNTTLITLYEMCSVCLKNLINDVTKFVIPVSWAKAESSLLLKTFTILPFRQFQKVLRNKIFLFKLVDIMPSFLICFFQWGECLGMNNALKSCYLNKQNRTFLVLVHWLMSRHLQFNIYIAKITKTNKNHQQPNKKKKHCHEVMSEWVIRMSSN